MEVNKDLLLRILAETTCIWTRGFLSCLLDTETKATSTDNSIAAEVIDSFGGQKIQAIKKIREMYGYGLKEAKDLVDTYARTGQIAFPDDPIVDEDHIPF